MHISLSSVIITLYSYISVDTRNGLPVPLHQIDKHQVVLETSANFTPSPASLPATNSTRAFWLHPVLQVNPLAKEGSEGPLTDEADVCIIGSGITGISAAYQLSNLFPQQNAVDSLKVVILEARDFCEYIILILQCISKILRSIKVQAQQVGGSVEV